MTDDIRDIEDFYDSAVEAEDARLLEHRLEHDITWRYLDEYLPPEGRILEVGAATGRYTVELCRRGYEVTAVDLSERLLERCRERLEAMGVSERARLLTSDARDLSGVIGTFDAALIMGPLYHLVEESDRRKTVQQAVERLRPGGRVFSAFLSRYGIFGDLIRESPDWIEKSEEVASFLRDGHRPLDAPRGGFRGYFARVEEIAPLHEAFGLHTLAIAGVEPAISADDASYNQLEGERRDLWLDLLYAVSRQPTTVAASRHLLYVGGSYS